MDKYLLKKKNLIFTLKPLFYRIISCCWFLTKLFCVLFSWL